MSSVRNQNCTTRRRPPPVYFQSVHKKPSTTAICQAVRLLTSEFLIYACEQTGLRQSRRRMSCHVRQIAMYVCHVALQINMTDIGHSFGRDRSTVAHACAVVEDRRDDRDFDEFVTTMERIALLAFGGLEGVSNEQ